MLAFLCKQYIFKIQLVSKGERHAIESRYFSILILIPLINSHIILVSLYLALIILLQRSFIQQGEGRLMRSDEIAN